MVQSVLWFLPKAPVDADKLWQQINLNQNIAIARFVRGVIREVFVDND